MVKNYILVLSMFFSSLFGASVSSTAPSVKVDVELQWGSIYENTPFKATLSITHDANNKIDEKSFEMKGTKLSSKFLKEVRFSPSSNVVISMYEIQFGGLPRGLQTLPPISAIVGGKKYSSSPSGFEVKSLEPGNNTPPPPPNKKTAPYLKLEVIAGDKERLYPGEKTTFGYRYIYNTDVDLQEEVLPLLEADGFKKEGEKEIEDGDLHGESVRQVTQKVMTLKPGTYTFPPSHIMGYPYTMEGGQKVYSKTPLRADVPSFKVTVLDFPKEGKPTSFNGAIGQYEMEVKLMTKPPVRVGDKIVLELQIKGEGDLESVKAPDLCCQPGFSGFFKTSDLPPKSEVVGNVKTFTIEIVPLNSDVESIPPISFSFFDPEKESYQELVNQGFPFRVEKSELPSPPTPMPLSSSLERSFPKDKNYYGIAFALPFSLTTIFFGASLTTLFITWGSYLYQKRAKTPFGKSLELFEMAKESVDSHEFFEKAKAFIEEREKFKIDDQERALLNELKKEVEVDRFNLTFSFNKQDWLRRGQGLLK